MTVKDYKTLVDLVRKYGVSTILRFVADAWDDVMPEKYEIKSINAAILPTDPYIGKEVGDADED